MSMPQCPKCKKPAPSGAAFCGFCEAILPSGQPEPVAPHLRPAVNGRFEVVEVLPAWGASKVYRAQNRMTKEDAGLRLLPSTLQGDEAGQEALREALSRAKVLVGVPGVLAVTGYEVEDKLPYFVLEPFAGQCLADRLKKDKRLPAAECASLGASVADALAAAMAKGVPHGDLRSSCVILGPGGEVRVTDFAVGRVLADHGARQMAAGGTPKAPWYRAPEQAKSGVADAKADQFSLGCLLFEAATGEKRLPDAFAAALKTPVAGAPFPDPFSGRKDLPIDTADVVRRLLAPHPKDRFDDVSNAAAALRGGAFSRVSVTMGPAPAAAGPAAAGVGGGASRSPRPGGGGRGAVVGIGLALAVAAAGGFAWWSWNSSRKEVVIDIPKDDASLALTGLPPPPPPSPAAAAAKMPEQVAKKEGRIVGRVDGGEMVFVPGGVYILGADDGTPHERPARKVTLAAFLIDRHEVTVGQYRRFATALKARVPPQPEGSTDRHPVVNVDFVSAAAYAKWSGKRLPTDDEWEAAARGPAGRAYPWGTEDDPAKRNGAGDADGHAGLAPAAAIPAGASSVGAFDMLGNAWEWCAGSFAGTPGSKSVRGGSWRLLGQPIRASFRNGVDPQVRWDDLGFRCAAGVP
jgi:hypothetical protein